MSRPPDFLAARSCSSIAGPMSPVGVSTISQVRFADLCRPQPSLDRQQYDQPVTKGMLGRRGEDKKVIGIVFG